MSVILPAVSGAFTWIGALLPHGDDHADWTRLAHSFLACGLILLVALIARIALMRAPAGREGLVPAANLAPRNLFELYTEAILNMVRGVLGKDDGDRFFPLIAGVFAYIFVSNVMGVIPGFAPPTDSLNTNLPMALTIFLVYNVSGIVRNGIVAYGKHFMGPVLWLAPLMVVIELISHLVRPMSLSIRLYGNISGDHLVTDVFMNQLPAAVHPILGYGLPVIFLGLGVFVSLIQAFVFSLLSMLYIALAVAHDEHH
jgi:F-type H+-transporting ATPase subunit a